MLGKSLLSDAEALQQKRLGVICSINTLASRDAPEQLPGARHHSEQGEHSGERATIPRAAAKGNQTHGHCLGLRGSELMAGAPQDTAGCPVPIPAVRTDGGTAWH